MAAGRRAGRPDAAGAAVPAGRLRLGGGPLVRTAAAAAGRQGPAAGPDGPRGPVGGHSGLVARPRAGVAGRRIDEGLRAYIDPLTEDEHEALERSLLAEGCRDALVLWGDLLVDGHNRYAICQKHGIEFQTRQNTTFKSMEDVHLWMIENHLGRRSVSDFQRGVLALRKKEILLARTPPEGSAPPDAGSADAASSEGSPPWDEDAPGADGAPRLPPNISWTPPVPSRQALARAARISSNTLGQIEKIQKDAAPELVRAVKEGAISINAAAAVASLPAERQAAAVAGGRKELQQAAREHRGLACRGGA
ncbi:hypothetical protein G6F22_014759 [Rhizopus arrhizus]|nr:hypothetical protein G6F22_014759 [Rhizopus arrhizus]